VIIYRPLKAIRLKCLDCSETRKDVAECSCNGVESPLCDLYPYRFGRRPRSQSQQAVLEGPAISKTLTVSQSQTSPGPMSIKGTPPRVEPSANTVWIARKATRSMCYGVRAMVYIPPVVIYGRIAWEAESRPSLPDTPLW